MCDRESVSERENTLRSYTTHKASRKTSINFVFFSSDLHIPTATNKRKIYIVAYLFENPFIFNPVYKLSVSVYMEPRFPYHCNLQPHAHTHSLSLSHTHTHTHTHTHIYTYTHTHHSLFNALTHTYHTCT